MRVFLPLLFLFGCGSEVDVNALKPRLAVAPEVLAFGEHAVPVPATESIYITNNGAATLEVTLDITGEGAAVFSATELAQTINANESWTLPIDFTPASYLDYEAKLIINSNDEDMPTAEVPLTGTGVYAPVPAIEVSPMTLDFGEVSPPIEGFDYITIRNVGEADLAVGEISQAGAGTFLLATDPSNSIIAGGDEVPVIIRYIPSSSDGDNGELVIPSNDPTQPETTVVLLGNGGGDFEYPVAQINCPGISAPPTWVQLSGSGSSDPNGLTPLTYSWTLVDKPAGSTASLTNLTTDSTSIFHDLAGNYVVELRVTNTAGVVSAPDRCTVSAIPEDDLHVELTWDTPGADLDLHLLDGSGALFEEPGDCTWCNSNPKWGQTGADDDPRLDIDDQGGWGPENINILAPQSGNYQIKVHYFEENGDDAVTAIVKVYTYGVLTWSGSKILYRNQVWDVGQVNWPAGTFGVQSVQPYEAEARMCY